MRGHSNRKWAQSLILDVHFLASFIYNLIIITCHLACSLRWLPYHSIIFFSIILLKILEIALKSAVLIHHCWVGRQSEIQITLWNEKEMLNVTFWNLLFCFLGFCTKRPSSFISQLNFDVPIRFFFCQYFPMRFGRNDFSMVSWFIDTGTELCSNEMKFPANPRMPFGHQEDFDPTIAREPQMIC